MKIKIRHLLFALTLLMSCGSAFSKTTGAQLAYDLKSNIVRVTSTNNCEADDDNGFGFIVSETCDHFYIITAYHVVCGPDAEAFVSFISDQNQKYPAVIKNSYADMALLKVERPAGYTWNPYSLTANYKKRDKLRIIGKEGAWRITTDDQLGKIVGIDEVNKEIKIQMAVAKGSSGGPVLNSTGIIGMVVRSGDLATVISIEAIARQVREWDYRFQLEATNVDPSGVRISTAQVRKLGSDSNFVELEKFLAIYSILYWQSCNQNMPEVRPGNNFGRSDQNFDLSCYYGTDWEHAPGGILLDCFLEPTTVYNPVTGEEVETTQLIANEDYWYNFNWDVILGYPVEITVNPQHGDYNLIDDIVIDENCQEATGESCYYPSYALELGGLWVNSSIELVVSRGYTFWYPDGNADSKDHWVVYLGSREHLGYEDLRSEIIERARIIGIGGTDIEQIAWRFYTYEEE